jgi:hypothetical protein
MSFSQFFEDLSRDINGSRAARNTGMQGIRAHIHALRGNVEDFLDTFRSRHKQMAKALRHEARDLKRRLKGDDKARVKAAHEMMREMRSRIGGIFSLTHSVLGDLAADLRRGGEIFRGNGPTSSAKETRKKKRQ